MKAHPTTPRVAKVRQQREGPPGVETAIRDGYLGIGFESVSYNIWKIIFILPHLKTRNSKTLKQILINLRNMSVFLKVEIPNLDITIFVGTYVHFSTLGTGVLPRPGRGTKLGILEPAHWLKHRVFIIPNNASLQNGIVKTRDQSSCLSFVVWFFVKLRKCITGPCWLLNILYPKFPPSIVLGLSGIIPATCTIRHTRCSHLHSTDVLGKSFQCTVPKHVVDMVVRYR